MYWQSFFKSFCLLRAEARKKTDSFHKKGAETVTLPACFLNKSRKTVFAPCFYI